MIFQLQTISDGPYRGVHFVNPQPLPLHPDTANFTDLFDRAALATLGIFSIDRTAHRAKRRLEAYEEATFDGAYEYLGLDRKDAHDDLCRRLETGRTDGIWARSTGEYTRQRRRLDGDTLNAALGYGYRGAAA